MLPHYAERVALRDFRFMLLKYAGTMYVGCSRQPLQFRVRYFAG